MAILRAFLINTISFLFTVFLSFKFFFSTILLFFIAGLPLRTVDVLKNNRFNLCKTAPEQCNEKKQNKKQCSAKIKPSDCFQSIIDSSISLFLTATLVNYNQFLIYGTLLISHKVHHSFLTLIYENIPDYTQLIQDSYSLFLKWTFILLGIFGIRTQLAFIIDLVHILTLPTKILYTFLRTIYSKSVNCISKLFEFITTNEKNWITCPYNIKYLNTNYRLLALMMLMILIQLTVFIIFYYTWLCLIILGLLVIENTFENIDTLLSRLGQYLCLIKKFDTKQQKKSIKQFYSIVKLETALKIIKGLDVFERKSVIKTHNKQQKIFSIKKIFHTFLGLFQLKQKSRKILNIL